MPIAIRPVLADAWGLFRRDRDWLLRVAGPFVFLPAFALALLVPSAPVALLSGAGTSEADALARAARLTAWMRSYGGWYLLANAVSLFGAAALLSAYLDGRAPDIRTALKRAGTLLPRYFLAMTLVAVPTGAGLYLWVLPGLYVMGRALLVGPVLIAERPVSALAALTRSFALSRGMGVPMMALAATSVLGALILTQPFAALELAARRSVVAAVVAAVGLGVAAMLATIAQVLIAVSVYRRLGTR
ncbi:hypothetical protein [uncultured Sphingomonas sp.]|uniref:hypothetical protein n=1 Tax=uncultured Sphingomonas sp. TaxID=158754 RepID=UPI0035CCA936